MKFSQLLSKYCQDLSCSNIELSKRTNIDPSLISRLKNGKRLTQVNKKVIKSISHALLEIANEKNIITFPKDVNLHLSKALKKQLNDVEDSELSFSKNFDVLLLQLNIKNNHIAKYLVVDPSYISRIRNNERIPFNLEEFINKVCKYLIKYYFDNESLVVLSELLDLDINNLTVDLFSLEISNYLKSNTNHQNKPIETFLKQVDKYQIQTLVKDQKILDEIENTFTIPKSRRYYDAEETKQSIIDFYTLVIKSDITSDIIVYNDFPLKIYWNDTMFIKKWLLLMQLAVEKGNNIYKIHYLDEPGAAIFDEINSWLPLYISGNVKPYYIDQVTHAVSRSLLLVASDICAVIGESTVDDNTIMTRLTKIPEEIKYYESKCKSFLEVAKPLAKIFFSKDEKEYEAYLHSRSNKEENYLRMINMPPNFTMTDSLFEKLLNNNQLSKNFIKEIKQIIQYRNNSIKIFLKDYQMLDVLSVLSEDEFKTNPRKMIIARSDNYEDIYYTYEDYLEHISASKLYAKENPNYKLIISNKISFENIEFYIKRKNCVVVEKINEPVVSIVFKNEKIVEAFEKEISLLIND